MDIFDLVRLAAEKGASDLHLVADNAPIFRIDGLLQAPGRMDPVDLAVRVGEQMGIRHLDEIESPHRSLDNT